MTWQRNQAQLVPAPGWTGMSRSSGIVRAAHRADIAVSAGCRVGPAVAGPRRGRVLHLFDESGTSLGVHVDTYHMNIDQAGDQLGHVHIGESHVSSAVVHPELSNQPAAWRNLCSDGDDLARHAGFLSAERLDRP
jgi:hypothetical protein